MPHVRGGAEPGASDVSQERAFIVETTGDWTFDPGGGNSFFVQKGDRFLVVTAIAPSGAAMPTVKLLAAPLSKSGPMVLLDPWAVKFLGFRGDCMLCGTRRPEEPDDA